MLTHRRTVRCRLETDGTTQQCTPSSFGGCMIPTRLLGEVGHVFEERSVET